MAGSGGKRIGAGRKSKAEELKIAAIAIESITQQHGSLENGFKWLLNSKEPSLIKFVFEHAAGKAPDKIEHSGDIQPLTLRIVRGKPNS